MKAMLEIQDIKTALHPVFEKFGVRRAVLFGSFAQGKQNERSDVDILVDSGLRGLRFFGLLEGVSEVLDRPVDLIDVSQIERDSVIGREIRKSGVQIYGP